MGFFFRCFQTDGITSVVSSYTKLQHLDTSKGLMHLTLKLSVQCVLIMYFSCCEYVGFIIFLETLDSSIIFLFVQFIHISSKQNNDTELLITRWTNFTPISNNIFYRFYCILYLTDCITYFNKENPYLQNEAQSPPLMVSLSQRISRIATNLVGMSSGDVKGIRQRAVSSPIENVNKHSYEQPHRYTSPGPSSKTSARKKCHI